MNNAQYLDVVEKLWALAESIQNLCGNHSETAEETRQPAQTPKPAVSLEKVRGILAEKSQKGYTAEVKALIRKYGAERLSDISPESFPDMLKEAEAIGNA